MEAIRSFSAINDNYAHEYRLGTLQTFDFPFSASANYNQRVPMSLNRLRIAFHDTLSTAR